MKKLFSSLLTAVVLCSMLAVPVFAAPKADVGVIDITSSGQFCKVLESLDDGRKVVLNLKINDICINHEINIEASDCSILIYSSNDDFVRIYPQYLRDDDNYRFLNINGDNVKLYFDSQIICKDFKKIKGRASSGSGGAIYVDGENCLIACGTFRNCSAISSGGAIYVNGAKTTIADCEFQNCKAINGGGGAIRFNAKEGRVEECLFEGNSCRNDTVESSKYYGDDVEGYRALLKDPDTVIQTYRSDSKRDDYFFQCIVNPEEVHWRGINIYEIFGTFFDSNYTRPLKSNYANNAVDNNKQCDVIRPDITNIVESDNGHFTLEGKNFYGGLWKVTYKDALTIKAKEGYTINRIEGVVAHDSYSNYKELSADKGTKEDLIDNPSYFGKSLEKDYIAKIDDINSDSVTLTTKGNIYNDGSVKFTEFIVYYTENSVLASAFSGGTLWIIIGVAAAAVLAAVLIVVAKKKKKPETANSVPVENSEKEDE